MTLAFVDVTLLVDDILDDSGCEVVLSHSLELFDLNGEHDVDPE